MSNTKVAIVKGADPKQMVHNALEMIDAGTVVSTSDKILLKPNYVAPKKPSTGITTDSRVVEGIIEFLAKKGARNITIGEGGNRHTDRTFDLSGVREIVHRHGLKIVNFNKDESVEVEIPSAKALHKVPIARTVLQNSCFLNVPKLKIHHMAQVTLTIKNLMGVIVGDRGAIMHKDIDDKLVDLATLVRPRFNVIDGIVGSEMDEVQGIPIEMNVVVAGMNMVATDAVGCAIMGVEPKTVRHLKLAEERGLGTADLDEITVLGEPIEKVRKKFRRGISKKRLKEYGLDHYKSEEELRPIWEKIGSNLRAHVRRS